MSIKVSSSTTVAGMLASCQYSLADLCGFSNDTTQDGMPLVRHMFYGRAGNVTHTCLQSPARRR